MRENSAMGSPWLELQEFHEVIVAYGAGVVNGCLLKVLWDRAQVVHIQQCIDPGWPIAEILALKNVVLVAIFSERM